MTGASPHRATHWWAYHTARAAGSHGYECRQIVNYRHHSPYGPVFIGPSAADVIMTPAGITAVSLRVHAFKCWCGVLRAVGGTVQERGVPGEAELS